MSVESLQNEEWKVCKDYPEYSVSNMGRVKSKKGTSERLIKIRLSEKHSYAYLYKNNITDVVRLDCLIINSFLGVTVNSWEVVYKDGDSKNVILENLDIKRELKIHSELWVTCEVCEDYSISSHGRLKRTGGFKRGVRIGFLQKPKISKNGYLCYTLRDKTKIWYKTAHSLVAEAFLGKKPSKNHEVNHKDGNKQNNFYKNLEYCTQAQNKRHAVSHNLVCYGERKPCAKITEKIAYQIKLMNQAGIRHKEISETLNIPSTIVCDTCRGRSWRRVTI